MQKVYEANSGLEANLLKNILQQEGIAAHVSGEYLQGAAGELPVMGLVSVWVDEGDVWRAEKIVCNWEQGSYAINDGDDDKKTPPDGGAFFAVQFIAYVLHLVISRLKSVRSALISKPIVGYFFPKATANGRPT